VRRSGKNCANFPLPTSSVAGTTGRSGSNHDAGGGGPGVLLRAGGGGGATPRISCRDGGMLGLIRARSSRGLGAERRRGWRRSFTPRGSVEWGGVGALGVAKWDGSGDGL